jgi:hypothetical protein
MFHEAGEFADVADSESAGIAAEIAEMTAIAAKLVSAHNGRPLLVAVPI